MEVINRINVRATLKKMELGECLKFPSSEVSLRYMRTIASELGEITGSSFSVSKKKGDEYITVTRS